MAHWVPVCGESELPPDGRRLLSTDDYRIAVFRVGNQLIGIDNHCPHRGGPIAAGELTNGCLTCPWHGLPFDLRTGRSIPAGDQRIKQLPTKVESDQILVDVASLESAGNEPDDGIQRFLVRYGRMGYIGCFGSIDALCPIKRGDQVVVQTARGREQGEVLKAADRDDPLGARPPAGELLGHLDPQQLAATMEQSHLPLLEAAREAVQRQGLAVVLVDGEVLLDGAVAVLYYLGKETAALGPLSVELGRHPPGRRVQFELADLADKPATRFPLSYQARQPSGGEQESPVKGPYERQKYDLRRVWECPICQHRERTSGSVTTMLCPCQTENAFTEKRSMRLVEDGPRRV